MERSKSDEASRQESAEDLVCALSHEVRNLLAAIQIHCHLLESAPAGVGAGGEAELIARSASQAGTLLAQVRPLLAGPRPAVEQVDPHRVLEALGHALERADRTRVSIASIPGGSLPPVAMDSECLHQLLLTGVFGALDASPPGARVLVSARRAADAVEFVLDAESSAGRGRTEQTRDSACDRPVAWRLAEAILGKVGGGLELAQTPDATRVSFRVPAAQPTPLTRGSETSRAQRTGSVSGKRLLLVEDRPEIRRFMGRILRSKGYSVLDAQDAKSALEIASTESGDIDLLLTDLIMPGMGGVELAEKITSIRPEAGVLFVSGDRNHPSLDPANLPSRSRALFKPFSSEDLISAVQDLLIL